VRPFFFRSVPPAHQGDIFPVGIQVQMIGGSCHVAQLVLPLIADFSNLHSSRYHVKFQVSLRRCPKHPEAFSGTHSGRKRLRPC